jgi:hypothetical protein
MGYYLHHSVLAEGNGEAMSELKELEAQITQLSKRVDEQARLSRNLTAICTTLTVGLMFFIFAQTMEHLPAIFILKYMSNLDPIVREWRQTERNLDKVERANPDSGQGETKLTVPDLRK